MRTKNQGTLEAILKYVNRYYQSNHASPTISEIAAGVGVSRATAHRYLQALGEEGLIDYDGGVSSAPKSAKMKTAYVSVPIVGSIYCGYPNKEEEFIEEYVSLPTSLFGKGNFYILRAKGDSMVDAGIEPGDLIVIDKDARPVEGSVVVALSEDNENTLKRFDGFEDGKAVLSYMNEATYPGKRILVDYFTCQGVAKHIIKSIG